MFNKKTFSILMVVLMLLMFIPNNVVLANNPNRDIPEITIDQNNKGSISFGGNNNPMNELSKGTVWNKLLTEYRGVITGIMGVATLTMIAVFILNLTKLATSSTNPSGRSQALSGLLWSGIATVGLGSVLLWVGFFYNAI